MCVCRCGLVHLGECSQVYSCVCVSVCVPGFVGWYIGVHAHMFTGVCACVTVCRCRSLCLGESACVYRCMCVYLC